MPTPRKRITSSDIPLLPARHLSDPNLRYGAAAGTAVTAARVDACLAVRHSGTCGSGGCPPRHSAQRYLWLGWVAAWPPAQRYPCVGPTPAWPPRQASSPASRAGSAAGGTGPWFAGGARPAVALREQ